MPPNLSTLNLAALSVGATCLLVYLTPQYPHGHLGLRTFFAVFLGLFALSIVWSVVLWPKLFSPLRKLPGPAVSRTFYLGLSKLEAKEKLGGVLHKWPCLEYLARADGYADAQVDAGDPKRGSHPV